MKSLLLLCLLASVACAQNNLRVHSVRFATLSAQTNQYTNESMVSDGYEMLIANPYATDGYPIVIYQNAGNQPIASVQVLFRIVNDLKGTVHYHRQTCIEKQEWHSGTNMVFCDANGTPTGSDPDSIPAGAYIKVRFPMFSLTVADTNKQGLYRFEAGLLPKQCNGGEIVESRSDDNIQRVFVYINANTPALQASTLKAMQQQSRTLRYHKRSDGILIPATDQWIVKGADIVAGEDYCYNTGMHNRASHAENDTVVIATPLIRMNRRGANGISPDVGGDTLISPIIDLYGKKGSYIAVEVQRAGRIPKDRFWCDSILQGPEHYVDGSASRVPDELLIELAMPTSESDYANTITWNIHPVPGNKAPITDNPLYSHFGGGGKRKGFSDVDGKALTRKLGLTADNYDDGKDEEFKTLWIPIPDTLVSLAAAHAMRLRLRVNARRNGNSTQTPYDDDDNFFIRSIALLSDTKQQDLALTSMSAALPYTVIPPNQAEAIPRSVQIFNNSTKDVGAFTLFFTDAMHKAEASQAATWKFRTLTIPFFPSSRSSVVTLPVWSPDATRWLQESDTLYLAAKLNLLEDANTSNDTLLTEVILHYGDVIAYDDTSIKGKDEYRETNGSTNQTIGLSYRMKFSLQARDTLYGYQTLMKGQVNVRFQLMDAQGSIVPKSSVLRLTGEPDVYSTTLLPEPLVLEAGEYSLAIGVMEIPSKRWLGFSAQRVATVSNKITNIPMWQKAQNLVDKNLSRTLTKSGLYLHGYPFLYANDVSSSSNAYPIYQASIFEHNGFFGIINGDTTYTGGSWLPCLRPYFPRNKSAVVVPSDTADPVFTGDTVVCASYFFMVRDSIVPSVSLNKASRNVKLTLDTTGTSVRVAVWLIDSTQNGFAALTIKGRKSTALTLTHNIAKLPAKPIISFSQNILSTMAAQEYQWYYNSTAIAGATTSGYIPSANGSYKVRIKNEEGCEAESDEYVYNLLSIEETQRGLFAGVQPNPAQGTATIVYHLPQSAPTRIEILDMNGLLLTELTSQTIQDGGTHMVEWDCHAVPNGVYMLRISSGTTSLYRKIVVLH